MEGLLPDVVFMIDTGAERNLVKIRNVHPDTTINKKDPLYLKGIAPGYIKSLGSIEVSLKGRPVKLDVVSDDFDIPQEGILGTDFLKPHRPMDIRYDVQGFVIWHDIKIPCTTQDSVVIPARTGKVFYVKVKNPEVKTGLVPRLNLGEGLYAEDAIVTNRNGKGLHQNHEHARRG
jgi:hypothetical protein